MGTKYWERSFNKNFKQQPHQMFDTEKDQKTGVHHWGHHQYSCQMHRPFQLIFLLLLKKTFFWLMQSALENLVQQKKKKQRICPNLTSYLNGSWTDARTEVKMDQLAWCIANYFVRCICRFHMVFEVRVKVPATRAIASGCVIVSAPRASRAVPSRPTFCFQKLF